MSPESMFIFILALMLPYFITEWKFYRIPKVLSIYSTGGIFSFLIKNYSEQEMLDFQRKINSFCRTPAKIPRYAQGCTPGNYVPRQSSDGKKWAIAIVCLVLFFSVAGGTIWYFQTHCKVLSCGEAIYREGYCRYHYAEKFVHDTYDAIEGIFGS